MALINRMSRLFTADVHAVLDRIEEPDVLLKHAIREMEEELARSEQRVKQLEHERDRARGPAPQGRRPRSRSSASSSTSAFDNGNEELARKIVKRKLETERLDKHVAERRARVASARRAPRDGGRAARAPRRDAAESRAPRGGAERAATNGARRSSPSATDEVEVAFLREQQKRKPS